MRREAEATVGDSDKAAGGGGLRRSQAGTVGERRGRKLALALSAAALALLVAAATALAVTGELTQLPGTAGCVSATGSGGECTNGKALEDAHSVAVSPDGTSVYVASDAFAGSIAVFSRNTTTGTLTQLAGTNGCVRELEFGPPVCADGKAIRSQSRTSSVVVSPDGENVYVTSRDTEAVAIFDRNTTTGALTQLAGTAGCVSETGSTFSGDVCADGRALEEPSSLAVSPDGTSVYVASIGSDAVAVFARNTTTGELTQLTGDRACVREAPRRGCTLGKALDAPVSVTVSPDNKSVYVTSVDSDAVAVFRRNTTTGALFQPPAGCVSETGSGGTCADGKALDFPVSVAVRPDGLRVYVASEQSNAVAVFRRNAATSALTQLVGSDGLGGCVSETGSGGECRDVKAVLSPRSLAVSGDGENVYVTSSGIIDEDDPFERGAVAIFRAKPAVGGLTQVDPFGTGGCVTETGSAGNCVDGRALVGARSVAVSGDGDHVYVAAVGASAVAAFARETPP
jgi:DNA-binding beta-propeller fold protein YncE